MGEVMYMLLDIMRQRKREEREKKIDKETGTDIMRKSQQCNKSVRELQEEKQKCGK